MWVCSEVPFNTCDPSAVFCAFAVDHDLARPSGRMIHGRGLKWQCLLTSINLDLGSAAGGRENTLSNFMRCDRSNDDGVFFADVMPDFASNPCQCSTACANTSAQTSRTTIAGPSVATSYSICALGTPNKPATWNNVSANTAAPLIHAGVAKATSLLARDNEA